MELIRDLSDKECMPTAAFRTAGGLLLLAHWIDNGPGKAILCLTWRTGTPPGGGEVVRHGDVDIETERGTWEDLLAGGIVPVATAALL